MIFPESQTVRVGSGLRGFHVVFGAAALVGLLAGGIWMSDAQRVESSLADLSLFQVRQIEVQAEWPVTPEALRSWVAPAEGKSLLFLDGSGLVANLKKKPWVDTVSLKKEYPDRILVMVNSKKPLAISLIKNQPYFIDEKGAIIDRVTPSILKGFDLPFLSAEILPGQWDMGQVLSVYNKVKEQLQGKLLVSEIVLGRYPYLKTYFSKPKLEVLWNYETWESQVPYLMKLVANPPSQVGQLQRINLVFPKKAVVSAIN